MKCLAYPDCYKSKRELLFGKNVQRENERLVASPLQIPWTKKLFFKREILSKRLSEENNCVIYRFLSSPEQKQDKEKDYKIDIVE